MKITARRDALLVSALQALEDVDGDTSSLMKASANNRSSLRFWWLEFVGLGIRER